VIVTFLAVLELIKQRELVAVQSNTFGEIALALADDSESSSAATQESAEAAAEL
jgi:chromatin segregation and condensation protein Rec8/ScpA/Scc1 (kleisin family)